MTAPCIGLTTYGRDAENRFHLFGEYVDAVRRAGGTSVLLPPGERDPAAWLAFLDGIVVTGGGDFSPEHVPSAHHAQNYLVDDERDRTELAFLPRVLEAGLPTLCVCRGMQALNIVLGGSLVAHVPERFGEDVLHRSAERTPIEHPVAIEADSLLADALGTTRCSVSSWHHQALDTLGADLRAVARSEDGLVEAVEHPAYPDLWAVQWHPELSAGEDPYQQRLFETLVERARAFRVKQEKPCV